MELEDWEYISEETLLSTQTIEEDLGNIEVQYQVVTIKKDQSYEILKEIKEVTEVDLQSLEGAEEEVQFEYEFEEESLLETESWGSVEGKESDDDGNGMNGNNWRWRMKGIGAVKYVGIAAAAAATLSVYILGGCKINQNSKLQVQTHGDVKRNKEAVKKETKLNEIFSDLGGTQTQTTSSYMYLDSYFPAF